MDQPAVAIAHVLPKFAAGVERVDVEVGECAEASEDADKFRASVANTENMDARGDVLAQELVVQCGECIREKHPARGVARFVSPAGKPHRTEVSIVLEE
jgi:hypothetical protein